MKKSLKKIVLLGAIAAISSTFTDHVNAYSENANMENEREPELVFPVLSDIHINGSERSTERFQRAMDQLNKIAPKQDAFVGVGDLTDHGYQSEYDRFMSVYNKNKQADAESVFMMGNHDYWNGLSKENAQKLFMDKMGTESLYYHKEIKGYHFISLSPEDGRTHGYYSTNQIAWLGEQLKKAQADKPNQPIFVFLHQHIKDTVYGSHEWGTLENKELLYDTLKQFPQVVTFSGHSHYPLDDPRSIHQKDFTSIGTSSVSYMEVEGGKLQGNLPPGYDVVSQGLVVEVYNNEVVLKRLDFHENDQTGNPWVIKFPAKTNKFQYTEDRDHLQPGFAQRDELSLVKEATTLTSMAVTVPQAKDNLLVHAYEVTAKNKKTGNIDKQFTAFSEFYKDPMPEKLTFPIKGLKPATEYEIQVQAIDAFGNRSKTILSTVGQTRAIELVSAGVTSNMLQKGETAEIQAKMKNHGTESNNAVVKVAAPEGWTVEESEQKIELAAGEEKTVTFHAVPTGDISGQAEFKVTAFEGNTEIKSMNVQVFVDMLLGENFNSVQSLLKPAVNENISPSLLGWTHTAPNGWSVKTNSSMPQGTEEWQGWSFTTKEFWTAADTQGREKFGLGEGVIAVADPDEWDDYGSPASKGYFDSSLISPAVSVTGGQDLYLGFATHYQQEGNQTAQVTVTFDNGQQQTVLKYDGNSASDNKGGHVLNKYETRKIQVPQGATTMQIEWKLYNAKNNWFWAIDDIRLDDQALTIQQ